MRGHTFGFVPLQNALILTFYATVSGLTSASVGVAREWPTFRGPERTTSPALIFTEDEKIFDPKAVYGDAPNPTQL